MTIITSYVIENDKEFQRQIDNAVDEIGDLRLAFTLISKDWRKSNIAQFSLRGSGQYQPLSPLYKQQKEKEFGDKPILVASGRLRDSVTGVPNRDSIQVITRTSLVMGTKVPYGIFHQSDAPRFKMPLRKFLFIGPEAPRTAPTSITGRLERWTSILNAEIARKTKGR